MATTTRLALALLFDEAIGDVFGNGTSEFATTTNITTDKKVISTDLNQHDNAEDGFGDNTKWLYITTGNNIGVERRVGSTTYATSSGTLYVYGANLLSESGAVTCRLTNYSYTKKVNALNRAIEQVSGVLFRRLEDRTLVTGNILPDNSFEMWTSASASSFYSTTNAALARTTTAGLIRGMMGTTSMKVTDSGSGGGYAYLSSNDYPRLLDLQGKTVTFKCWARPDDNDDDAQIEIWTQKETSTGVTTQTLTSSTASYEDKWALLALENQTLNDDLTEIQLRFKVVTASADVYFDSARIVGMGLKEYLLLSDFDTGVVSQVYVQSSGYSDDICDDLNPRYWEKQEFGTIHDGTYLYLRLKNLPVNNRQIRVIGAAPLESLSADTDTISISGDRLNLLIAKAAYLLYMQEEEPVSSEDVSRYSRQSSKWLREYNRLLPGAMMTKPSSTLFTG